MDSIKQIGNIIKNTSQQTNYALDRLFGYKPKIERIRDIVDTTKVFKMTFKTETSNRVTLSLTFYDATPMEVIYTAAGSSTPPGVACEEFTLSPCGPEYSVVVNGNDESRVSCGDTLQMEFGEDNYDVPPWYIYLDTVSLEHITPVSGTLSLEEGGLTWRFKVTSNTTNYNLDIYLDSAHYSDVAPVQITNRVSDPYTSYADDLMATLANGDYIFLPNTLNEWIIVKVSWNKTEDWVKFKYYLESSAEPDWQYQTTFVDGIYEDGWEGWNPHTRITVSHNSPIPYPSWYVKVELDELKFREGPETGWGDEFNNEYPSSWGDNWPATRWYDPYNNPPHIWDETAGVARFGCSTSHHIWPEFTNSTCSFINNENDLSTVLRLRFVGTGSWSNMASSVIHFGQTYDINDDPINCPWINIWAHGTTDVHPLTYGIDWPQCESTSSVTIEGVGSVGSWVNIRFEILPSQNLVRLRYWLGDDPEPDTWHATGAWDGSGAYGYGSPIVISDNSITIIPSLGSGSNGTIGTWEYDYLHVTNSSVCNSGDSGGGSSGGGTIGGYSMALPSDCTIWIDGKDVTYQLFGSDTITPTATKFSWQDIDISGLVKGKGLHTLEVRAGNGSGRVDARIEVR